jgi:hypothetical protein
MIEDMERLAHRFDTIALRPQKHGVPVFRCPVCANIVRNDATAMEPACTGPGAVDVHPLTIMVRVADDTVKPMLYLPHHD